MADFKSQDPELGNPVSVEVITLDNQARVKEDTTYNRAQIKNKIRNFNNKSSSCNNHVHRFLKSVCKYFAEFMVNSTIHGLKYLVGNDRTIFEKIWWLFVLSISIYTCANLIGLTWKKWEENPIFISSSQNSVRIWEIPFPAVTICPHYRFRRNSTYNFTYRNFSNGFIETRDASSVCKSHNYDGYEFVNFTTEPEVTEFFLKTALRRNDVLSNCKWRRHYYVSNCEHLITPVVTSWGLCFSFNILGKNDLYKPITYLPVGLAEQPNMSHWTPDKNYDKTNETGFPVRMTTPYGYLSFVLNGILGKLGCVGYNGFTVIVHHPAASPAASSQFLTIDTINNNHYIWIKPEITTTSNNLKSYPPHRRKCFYSDERLLKFFKVYTFENCLAECLANRSLQQCGCSPNFLPHDVETTLCRAEETCFGSFQDFVESEFGINGDPVSRSCGCLPSCLSIIYKVDVDTTTVNRGDANIYFSIKFKDAEFVPLERQELFGDVNFWANCGGLVGLFTGFSVLSLAEMVYFLSLRWMCNLRRRLSRRMQMGIIPG